MRELWCHADRFSGDGKPVPVDSGTYEYELFIVHAAADGPFVHGQLLPALGIAAERVLLSCALRIGEPITTEIERGVQNSRLTVVVLTPAYMTDRWAIFGEQLASHANSIDGRVVPLLRADCDVPLRLDFLVALDFRNPDRWPAEAQRLRDRLAQPAPVIEDIACPYPGMRPYAADDDGPLPRSRHRDRGSLGRLRAREREIYVVGPSGSGKSSLVERECYPGSPGV